MPASMTCKLFKRLLPEISKHTLDHNDPYYVKTFYSRHIISTIEGHIGSITNHNCLNYIFESLFDNTDEDDSFDLGIKCKADLIKSNITTRFTDMLLIQNCEVNNVSKPQNIYTLIDRFFTLINIYPNITVKHILNIAFNNDSFDVIMILLTHEKMKKNWKHSAYSRYQKETNIDKWINEINFLVNNHIIALSDIYSDIYNYQYFPVKNDIIAHLAKSLNKNIVTAITKS
jgi:hypothetical protein